MAGTVTITSPATDSASGYSSNSIQIVWTFTGNPSSTTQTRYRVTWQPTGSSNFAGDTGYVTSTANTATVSGLGSGTSYDVYVYVYDSAGTTSSAKRIVVANFQRSLAPVVTFGVDNTETLVIYITNPTDGSSRPLVQTNTIYRRHAGSNSDWTLVGTVGRNGNIADRFPPAGARLEFFARTDSGAESLIAYANTPQIRGFWMHDPQNVDATLRNFRYTDGSNEQIGVDEQILQLVGRAYPMVETGVAQTQQVAVNATIPFSDLDWMDQVAWWRARKLSRTTLVYRDGRGRGFAVRIVGDVSIGASRTGTVVSCQLQRVDYTFYTVTIPSYQYGQGQTNDGGFGVNGFGVNGFGL